MSSDSFQVGASCVSVVLSIAAVVITGFARSDSRKAAKAAAETAQTEAGALQLERERHHQALTPDIEVDYEQLGAKHDIPMIVVTSALTNPMTYTTVQIRLEDVQGRPQGTTGLSQLTAWKIAEMKPGDTQRAQIYRPDKAGGSTRLVCSFTSHDGDVWEIHRIIDFPPHPNFRIMSP